MTRWGKGESRAESGCLSSGPRCKSLLPTCKGGRFGQGSPRFPSKFPVERMSLHKEGDTRRPPHEYVEVSGRTRDLSSIISTQGAAQTEGTWEAPSGGA